MPDRTLPPYTKAPISKSEQVQRLRDLGVAIVDEDACIRFLTHTSYYRLKGYLLAFRKLNAEGKPLHGPTSFEDVAKIVEFDSLLRSLTLTAIDALEVSVRTLFNELMAAKYNDAFWYQDSSLFSDSRRYGQFLSKCARDFTGSKELFAAHYNKTYGKPPLPPGWMLIEVCSLGTWSHLYSNLVASEDKKMIANAFGLQKRVFESWLKALNTLRNSCAHQSRIWNRKFGSKPMVPNCYKFNGIGENHPYLAAPDRFSVMAMMIQHMLSNVRSEHSWYEELRPLVCSLPDYRQFNMGFVSNWWDDSFWDRPM